MELRQLTSKDIFPMSKIISKIGIKEFKDCFGSDDVKAATRNKDNVDLTTLGMNIMFDVGGVILTHLPDCEKDLYTFLADLSGASVQDLRNISMAEFMEMIVDLVQKEEFRDFFRVASRLFNSEQ